MSGVTLKKLAELSGLSIRTVNRVLKDQGDVSPEKRALVRELAAKYDYMPNIAARNFRLRRNNVVGVIMYDRMLCEANMQKLAELERALTAAGYYPLLGGACGCDVRRTLEEWNGIVGVVVLFNCRTALGGLPEEKRYPYTFILVDGRGDGVAGGHRVNVDREPGISGAYRALIDAGCRRTPILFNPDNIGEKVAWKLTAFIKTVSGIFLPEILVSSPPDSSVSPPTSVPFSALN